MSKLAELLVSRGLGAANPANPANPANLDAPGQEIRNFRNFRKGLSQDSAFTPELKRRIRAMAARWNYSPEELQDALERARANPAGWLSAVAYDEEREAEFRANGILPKAIA